MTYTVHAAGLGEVCRVPSAYFQEAHKWFAAYVAIGIAVVMLRDGETVKAFAP